MAELEPLDDPVLRHLPADPPHELLRMGAEERGRRGRVFLVLWCAGYVQVHAWALAMGPRREVDDLWAATGPADDATIERMCADRATLAAVAGEAGARA